METNSSFARVVYVLALTATIIGFTAFSQTLRDKSSFRTDQSAKDDTSKSVKRHRNDVGNLDQLDVQMKQLDMQLSHLNEDLKNIDFDKTQKQIDEALKKIDMEKISADVQKSLNSVNWDQINKQINESVGKLDKVQMDKIKTEMEKVKVQLEKQKSEMHFAVPDISLKKIRIQTEDAMKNAKRSISNAKEEIQNLPDFTNALQADGLINKSKPYKIEVRDGELYLNDKRQSKEVSDKFRKFYRKQNFTIDMNENGNKI